MGSDLPLMNEITHYSPFSQELENKDAVGNYTSAHFGYKHSLPVSLVNNAPHKEHWSANYEEGLECELQLHTSPTGGRLSGKEAHTGNKSVNVVGSPIIYEFEIE